MPSVRVLVTGSSGFIGRALCASLAQRESYEVHGLDVKPPPTPAAGLHHHPVDLLDGSATRALLDELAPECVVHLAAQTRVVESLQNPTATYRANVDSTINLLDAARADAPAIDRFILLSSETVYGLAERYPTPEESALNPSSPYAASKAACELLVRQALGDRVTVLRSAHTFGPGIDPEGQMVGRFIVKALRGETIRFPSAASPRDHPTRDLNFIENLLAGISLAMERGRAGVFNIGSGRETSSFELASKVVALAGSGTVESSPEVKYRFGEAGLRTWLDISRAERELGYHPTVGLEDGLRRTIAWFRETRPSSA